MENEISNRNKPTRSNADARLTPGEFYEPGSGQEIAIREMGGVEAFNDCIWHLNHVEELRREEGVRESIAELKSLMRGHHNGNNSSGNLKISASSTDRIAGR